jgi:hypothetical protein
MKNFAKIVLLLGAIMALGGIASAQETDIDTVTATGSVPDVLTFNIVEETVAFGDIYAATGKTVTKTGSGSSFSTGAVAISRTITGHTLNDGLMYDADLLSTPPDPRSLITPMANEIKATKDALIIGPSIAVGLYAPGTFALVTSYTQAYADGDYAGSYSASIVYTATATF